MGLFAKKNRDFWQMIVSGLGKENFIRTKKQCEKKMDSLKTTFRKAVDSDEKMENFAVSWIMFSHVHKQGFFNVLNAKNF